MKYCANLRLYNSYFDANCNLRPQSILAIFQDVASHHAEILNVGFDNLYKNGICWVISRLKYEILRQPKIDDEVLVYTWPLPKGRVDFDRDYLICDLDGNILVKGTSKWCVIDVNLRRLVLPSKIEFIVEETNERAFEGKLLKNKIVEYNQQNYCGCHIVTYSDLDRNGHMNNTFYANVIQNLEKTNTITEFSINYNKECRLGDSIEIFYSQVDDYKLYAGYVNKELSFTVNIK